MRRLHQILPPPGSPYWASDRKRDEELKACLPMMLECLRIIAKSEHGHRELAQACLEKVTRRLEAARRDLRQGQS
jgi:hypothetical protein